MRLVRAVLYCVLRTCAISTTGGLLAIKIASTAEYVSGGEGERTVGTSPSHFPTPQSGRGAAHDYSWRLFSEDWLQESPIPLVRACLPAAKGQATWARGRSSHVRHGAWVQHAWNVRCSCLHGPRWRWRERWDGRSQAPAGGRSHQRETVQPNLTTSNLLRGAADVCENASLFRTRFGRAGTSVFWRETKQFCLQEHRIPLMYPSSGAAVLLWSVARMRPGDGTHNRVHLPCTTCLHRNRHSSGIGASRMEPCQSPRATSAPMRRRSRLSR